MPAPDPSAEPAGFVVRDRRRASGSTSSTGRPDPQAARCGARRRRPACCCSTAWRRPPGAGPPSPAASARRPASWPWTCAATGSPTRRPTAYDPDALAADAIAVAEGAGLLAAARATRRAARSCSRGSATAPIVAAWTAHALGDRCARPRPGRRRLGGPGRGDRGDPGGVAAPRSRSRPRCSRRWAPGSPTARPSTRRPGTPTRSGRRGPRWSRRPRAGSSSRSTRTPWRGSVRAMWSYDPAAVLPTRRGADRGARRPRRGRVAGGRAAPTSRGSAPAAGRPPDPRRVVPGARAQPGAPRARRRGRGRARGCRRGYDAAMTGQPLPDHVRSIVDEIETEIGEVPRPDPDALVSAAAIEGGARRPAGEAERARRGRRPRDPPRDRRGPRSPGPRWARPSASTGCTPS